MAAVGLQVVTVDAVRQIVSSDQLVSHAIMPFIKGFIRLGADISQLLPHLTSKRQQNVYNSRLHCQGGIMLRRVTQDLPAVLPYDTRLVDALVIQA